MMKILISDELLTGVVTNQFELEISTEAITAEELIQTRVLAEVQNYNNKLPEYFSGLIEPSESEKTLNGYKLKKRQVIDPEKQVYVALDAFQKNGFFMLVDDRQIDELDQKLSLTETSKISFIKLTPLIGG
ncbi:MULTISPECIES: hypothetical protein [unclassified Imperialibacter]|uniref:hypothetical protein n=1 Tax=unclassified Imperialibacter TaxID=2629706 RepID=UPI00125AF5E3|nr:MULTISPECIES: hypothetical protein [unclassified Imperialibacter]CAD5250447.1 conserved hypothetical protein [Imperialibacter sp. 75]VVT05892.1 conserved hypothetical protein [Imperialibacter sp. EC-SDR9]